MKAITYDYRKEIGKRIKQKREELKETQEVFSEKVGVSKQTIVNLENGLGSLKLEYLYQISNHCNCDIGFLLGECDLSSYDFSFIANETGLSEEAIKKLKDLKTFLKKIGKEKECNTDIYNYMDTLNNFIISSNSPIIEISDYRNDLKIKREIESKPYFEKARAAFLKAKKSNSLYYGFLEDIKSMAIDCDKNILFSDMAYYDLRCCPEILDLTRAKMIIAIDNYLKTL